MIPITTVIAILAFSLSLYNAWVFWRHDQVRLKVIPQHYTPTGMFQTEHENFRIEVINLSEFPVVIIDIGFQLTDKTPVSMLSFSPGHMNAYGGFPQTLNPHRSCSAWFWLDVNSGLDVNHVEIAKVKCAYAKTECGTEIRGTSPALRGLVKEAVDGS